VPEPTERQHIGNQARHHDLGVSRAFPTSSGDVLGILCAVRSDTNTDSYSNSYTNFHPDGNANGYFDTCCYPNS
jgi:hypothetical protein